MEDNKIKFSIIIPSYNEGEDIRLSIESAINQRYPAEEILVVDDSGDNTPIIISEYKDKGVVLVGGQRKGCCGARNLGMSLAKGDVIVLLNGDVVLPVDFLEKLKAHYENGADYVLADAKILNPETIWARYTEAIHRYYRKIAGNTPEWTEGFSCRREAAKAVGYIPGDFPLRFCRDWQIGKKLGDAGYKKVIDYSILVTHKAPDNFHEFYNVRKARGRFGALTQHFIFKRSTAFLVVKFILKDLRFIFRYIFILPILFWVIRVVLIAKLPVKNILLLLPSFFISDVTFVLGEWEGIDMILQYNKGVINRK